MLVPELMAVFTDSNRDRIGKLVPRPEGFLTPSILSEPVYLRANCDNCGVGYFEHHRLHRTVLITEARTTSTISSSSTITL
jgi:hypothetical protein